MGPLNLTPKQFWALTWADFFRLGEGYKYRNEIEWTHTRFIVATLININRDTSKYPEPIKPSEVVPLSFDADVNNEIELPQTHFTREEMEKIRTSHGFVNGRNSRS